MEDATAAIDDAADCAADGKISEAIEKYRKALDELDKVERENPERAATVEFASVRNKRAYVNAAIDSLLIAQARENAKAVAVTDTTELEKRFAERRRRLPGDDGSREHASSQAAAPSSAAEAAADVPKLENQKDAFMEKERARKKAVQSKAARAKMEGRIAALLEKDPSSPKARVMQAGLMMGDGDLAGAKQKLAEVLAQSPADTSALNMMAVCAATEGGYSEADDLLSRAIKANPRDYCAYYNMANLVMQATGEKAVALKYYETGRKVGGPEDKALEESLK
jgi:tetratricopeptide (TPR) repeat protein